MCVCGTIKQKMMDRFVGIQTLWASRGVDLANSVQESVEWGMPRPQLNENTSLRSGQVVSGPQESWGGQLSVDLFHLPLPWGSGPHCLPLPTGVFIPAEQPAQPRTPPPLHGVPPRIPRAFPRLGYDPEGESQTLYRPDTHGARSVYYGRPRRPWLRNVSTATSRHICSRPGRAAHLRCNDNCRWHIAAAECRNSASASRELRRPACYHRPAAGDHTLHGWFES